MKKTLMNTIGETYRRCVEENIGISQNHLRYLCKNSIIPTCRIGNKYLINWQILMDYLNGKLETPQVKPESVKDEEIYEGETSLPLAQTHRQRSKIRKIRAVM